MQTGSLLFPPTVFSLISDYLLTNNWNWADTKIVNTNIKSHLFSDSLIRIIQQRGCYAIALVVFIINGTGIGDFAFTPDFLLFLDFLDSHGFWIKPK